MQLNRQGGKHGGIEEWDNEGEGTEHRAYLSKGTIREFIGRKWLRMSSQDIVITPVYDGAKKISYRVASKV
jgi:hypothetical protein